MLRICALLVILGGVHSAVALDPHKALTQYSISIWTQQQGLPQDTIGAITQTSDGYLWLGTDEGLARFHGYEFTIFTGTMAICPRTPLLRSQLAGTVHCGLAL